MRIWKEKKTEANDHHESLLFVSDSVHTPSWKRAVIEQDDDRDEWKQKKSESNIFSIVLQCGKVFFSSRTSLLCHSLDFLNWIRFRYNRIFSLSADFSNNLIRLFIASMLLYRMLVSQVSRCSIARIKGKWKEIDRKSAYEWNSSMWCFPLLFSLHWIFVLERC